MIIDLDSWEAGYYDGLLGCPSQCMADLDSFSYSSGYCQARACTPELRESLRLRYLQRPLQRRTGSSRLVLI
jgi:hypothetical protein